MRITFWQPHGCKSSKIKVMTSNLSYYSGKIEGKPDGCYVGSVKIDCPGSGQTGTLPTSSYKLDLLPPNPVWEIRDDLLFSIIFGGIVLLFSLLAVFKTKILGKTLGEYLKPIWYFVLVSILTVLWQYLFGLKIDDNLTAIRISQWIWELMVLASAYKLSKIPNFAYGNMFFLGVLYSLIIHGLKVTIRYFFYAKTLWYVADRFLYGSLLVIAIAFVLGSVFIYLEGRNKRF